MFGKVWARVLKELAITFLVLEENEFVKDNQGFPLLQMKITRPDCEEMGKEVLVEKRH